MLIVLLSAISTKSQSSADVKSEEVRTLSAELAAANERLTALERTHSATLAKLTGERDLERNELTEKCKSLECALASSTEISSALPNPALEELERKNAGLTSLVSSLTHDVSELRNEKSVLENRISSQLLLQRQQPVQYSTPVKTAAITIPSDSMDEESGTSSSGGDNSLIPLRVLVPEDLLKQHKKFGTFLRDVDSYSTIAMVFLRQPQWRVMVITYILTLHLLVFL